jgi:hypothetical protein
VTTDEVTTSDLLVQADCASTDEFPGRFFAGL